MSAAAVPNPASPSHRFAKPRRRRGVSKGELFGCLKPVDNPLAVRSYALSLYGLIPLAGAVCGPAAVGLGVVGGARRLRKPECGGGNFALAALVLGGLETLTHAVGLGCIARGMGWL